MADSLFFLKEDIKKEKELGLNPGSMALQATTLTTTIATQKWIPIIIGELLATDKHQSLQMKTDGVSGAQ